MSPGEQILLTTFTSDTSPQSYDNEWQGDNLSTDKDTRSTRIMFHNVNGLATKGVKGIDMFAHEQVNLQVDIQCFSEHCLDTTKFQVTNDIYETLQKSFPSQNSLQIQSSPEAAVNTYKPGGTGILMIGTTVGRQEPQGKGGDALGRWSYLQLRRRDSPPLTIISAYQVCSRPTNIIGNTAYHQQIRALGAQGRHTTHPRQAFIHDLNQFIDSLRAKGHEIILGGDFNESLDDKNSGVLKLLTNNNLTDPFLYRFPHHHEFGTHAMGRRRIDLVLVTPTLLPCITRVGYAPFQYGIDSDHRPILLEFNTRMLFGQANSPLQSMPFRQVKSNDKKSVSQFISKWYEEVSQRQGFGFRARIDDDSASPNIVEMVDEIIGAAGDIAEQSCSKRRPEFYSQQIVQQRIRVSILRGHLNALRMGKDRSMQLTRRMERLGLEFPLPSTQRSTLQTLKQAHEELRKTCRQSAEVRQEELQAKIEAALEKGKRTKAQILKAIKTVENNQKTYRILQSMKQRAQKSPTLDRLEIPESWPPREQAISSMDTLEDPKTCTQWRIVTQPQDIEYYLMLRNRMHFGQAQGTPFTCLPLHHDFDWLASTPEADQVLHGNYSASSRIAPNCQDLLKACTSRTTLDATTPELSMEEFRGKICSWRENTTTSPSGRHLGRYKALFAKGCLESAETSPCTMTLEAKQDALASLILSVINYCIRNTYVLERWKKIVNVMIFKESNNYKIHRLRVIHIYEADFNLILAIKWRHLLRHADEKNLLNEGQYGGRPGCEAQSLTLLEELKYDLSYLTRRTLVNFDNDASSCYDRIIVSLASIINRKYGMNRKTVAIHAATLQQAQFHLKTAYGVSTTHYSPSVRFPIHGTGQGSGNSPSIWLFISSTLYDIHNTLSHGAQFATPDGSFRVRSSMVGFVDDSTGSCNDFQPQHEVPLPELLSRMESDAQLWSNLLYCTGGKLELPKCSFHVLSFQFRSSGAPIPTIDLYDNRIHILDLDTSTRIQIPSKRSFDCHKTLGHFKSPNSNQTMELAHIRSKADRIALLISISPITRQGAYLAYCSVYLPSVTYVLPQSFFSRQVLEVAQAKSMQLIIAKCGYNRHTARALICAPLDYAGGGFLPWYLLQGEGQIKHFMKHWRTNTLVSRTLRVTVIWAQWQAGHEVSILEDPATPLPYLECRWLRSLRDFLQHIHAQIKVDIRLAAQSEKQHDIYIMQYARQSGLFTAKDLIIINYCRLYLHVTTVSELFDANGQTILPEIFECQREAWFNPDTYVTLQRRPSSYQIRMKWQRLCRQWSTADGKIAASIKFGKWRVPGHQLRRRRQTYIDPDKPAVVYHWRQNQYWEYHCHPTDRYTFVPYMASPWRPEKMCTPITVSEQADGSVLTTIHRLAIPTTVQHKSHILSFNQYINTLAPWEQSLLQGVQLRHQPYEIMHYLSQLKSSSPAMVVSDGSQRGTFMSYGWVFGSSHQDIYAEHAGPGEGTPTSHRAEAWGMLSGVLFLQHLYKYTNSQDSHSATNAPIIFFSDNKGLVARVHQRRQYDKPYPNATLAPDWDLIEQIVQIMNRIAQHPLEVQWVKGHQDGTMNDLTTEAIYNVRADELAGRCLPDGRNSGEPIEVLPAERCRLIIQKNIIQGHYTKHIRQAYVLPAYHQYLEKRYGWTTTQIQNIDWMVLQRASGTSHIDPVRLLKLVYSKLPTNSELAKVNPHQSATCHYCPERETFQHLLTCTNPISTAFRTHLREAVALYLYQQDFPSVLAQSIKVVIDKSIGISPEPDNLPNAKPAFHGINEQLEYGDNSFIHGFITRTWREIYDHSHQRYGVEPIRNSIDVLSGLIKVIWQQQISLWEKHLSMIQTNVPQTPYYDKLAMYRSRVRQLHSQRHQCLPGHQEQYFHSNVEAFLATANNLQLKQYLHHYEPAIQASIKAANQNPVRTILSFPGFTRTPQRIRTNSTPTAEGNSPGVPPHQLTNVTSQETTSHALRGFNLNRKHTRWKNLRNPLQTIRSFFRQQPD